MCMRSSSVPKYSTLISTNRPQLRSMASRHIFWSSGDISSQPELRMSMACHVDGSLQRLCHEEHTICALSRTWMAPSLSRIDAVTSRGSFSQPWNSSAGSGGGGSISRFSRKGWDFPGKQVAGLRCICMGLNNKKITKATSLCIC